MKAIHTLRTFTMVNVESAQPFSSHVLSVGPGFFTTMQIPLVRGRNTDDRDRPGWGWSA